MTMKNAISLDEAAKKAQINASTLHDWIEENVLIAHHVDGKPMIDEDELNEILAIRVQHPRRWKHKWQEYKVQKLIEALIRDQKDRRRDP